MNHKRILVISDLHIPYHHQDAFKFLKAIKKEFKPDRIGKIGDCLDFHAISMHDHKPDLPSAGTELALSKEYTERYDKFHACHKIIQEIGKVAGDYKKITVPPLCMPDEFKDDDFVRAYRNYYVHKIGQWKHQPK